MTHSAPINLAKAVGQITEYFHPQHALTINDSHSFKLANIKGPFLWHAHPHTDEVFYVISGGPLNMEIATNQETKHESDGFETVVLNIGDMFNVPKGYRHRPVAEAETGVLIIEKVGTTNTGDEEHSEEGKQRTRHVDEGAKA